VGSEDGSGERPIQCAQDFVAPIIGHVPEEPERDVKVGSRNPPGVDTMSNVTSQRIRDGRRRLAYSIVQLNADE